MTSNRLGSKRPLVVFGSALFPGKTGAAAEVVVDPGRRVLFFKLLKFTAPGLLFASISCDAPPVVTGFHRYLGRRPVARRRRGQPQRVFVLVNCRRSLPLSSNESTSLLAKQCDPDLQSLKLLAK